MMTTIVKAWTFESAHYLPNVRDGHKCKRMHGHSYRLEIELSGEPEAEGNSAGMIWDYDDLDELIQPVLFLVDHRLLNEIAGLDNPTTEILARWIAERLLPLEGIATLLTRVRVYESTTTYAEILKCDWNPDA